MISYFLLSPSLAGATPIEAAQIQQWFGFSAFDVSNGPFLLRLHHIKGRPIDVEAVTNKTAQVFRVLETHLSDGREFLELNRVTIADLAVFPYIALAVDGKVDFTPYPKVSAWVDRIKHQSWYVGMASIPKPDN